MLRPIRTTQPVPFVCLFDASVALKKGVENPRAPQWVHRDDSSIESVGADASIAWVHLLNDQECREWQARIGAETVDSQAVARELARVKCDKVESPPDGPQSVSELPLIAQTTLGMAVINASVLVEDPRRAICSE